MCRHFRIVQLFKNANVGGCFFVEVVLVKSYDQLKEDTDNFPDLSLQIADIFNSREVYSWRQ